MKTLILNGSPRRGGDTAALVAALKGRLTGEVAEVSAYYDRISPCVDCRRCWVQKGCALRDDMDILYRDDFDAVVLASPLHMSGLPGPVVSLLGRFQAYYAAKRFLHDPIIRRKKRAVLLLVGGGDGSPEPAVAQAKSLFRALNATLGAQDTVFSLHTDDLPAGQDGDALQKIAAIARRLNGEPREEEDHG